MTLTFIIIACVAGGLLSILIAALVAYKLSPQRLGVMTAFAAGTMLAAALLDILPEAFELAPQQHANLFALLLIGLIAFYALERAAIWRHTHASLANAAPSSVHPDSSLDAAPWVILLGDGVHNFVNGVLIAAAFLVDPMLGLVTTLAVVAHEIPQELGDFVVLLNAGWSKRSALIANALSSLASVAGGVLGWWALEDARAALPYALVIAASSFLYIAMSDLLPHLHRRHAADGFARQSALLVAGLVSIPLIGHWLH